MSNKALTKSQTASPVRHEARHDLPVYTPRVDIAETETEVHLLADMPGVDEKHVDIDVERNILTIRGRSESRAPAGYTVTFQEYEDVNYERTFTLGDTIDRNGIRATVKDGVLGLVLPKAKGAQPRRIAVKAG